MLKLKTLTAALIVAGGYSGASPAATPQDSLVMARKSMPSAPGTRRKLAKWSPMKS